MDGYVLGYDNEIVPVVFLTSSQATFYGGYMSAAKALGVGVIRSPIFLEEHYPDMSSDYYPEVGHA